MPPLHRRLAVSGRSLALSLLVLAAGAAQALAQCDGNSLIETDYLVRDVKVEALFGRVAPGLRQLLGRHRGERYKPFDTSADFSIGTSADASTSVFMNEVNDFLETPSDDSRFGVGRYAEVSIEAYTTCVKIVSAAECQSAFKDNPRAPVTKCVDVTVKVKAVRVNTGSLSANLLSIARWNKMLFHSQLPRPLLAFNPAFWMDRDSEYGTAAAGSITTNLLDLPAIWRGKTPDPRRAQLLFKMDGRKSANDNFYNTTTSLALLNFKSAGPVETLSGEGRFTLNRQPQGSNLLFTNAGHFNGNALFKIKHGPVTKIGFGAGYRWANNRYFTNSGATIERVSENGLESRLIADGHLGHSYLRGGVWFDQAWLDKPLGSYRRLAGMFGFTRDFVLAHESCRLKDEQCSFSEKNAPALGVELVAGGGRSWGAVPEYARFFGGNATGNFLYDGYDSPHLVSFPAGPLIRSFGMNQALARTQGTAAHGGTAYWNFNLTVSVPIPALSRPLIPALPLSQKKVSSCQECSSVKDSLKNNASNSKTLFIDATAFRNLSKEQQDDLRLDPSDGQTVEEQKEIERRLKNAEAAFEKAQKEASAEADEIWRQITPMVNYIADNANLYSIKPIVMFDAARLYARGEMDGQMRYALGGGLQFNVVVAKFEAGYLKTLHRLPGDQRGNFVVRMVFEKFF